MTRVMPIMGGTFLKTIPWGIIETHERQALKNHGQTLKRLAQRGGLGADEALAIILGTDWFSMTVNERKQAESELESLVVEISLRELGEKR